MAFKYILVRNNTDADIELSSLGETVSANDTLELSDYPAYMLRSDSTLINSIKAGDISVNDGTYDYDIDLGVDYVSNDTIPDEDGYWYGKRRRFSVLWEQPSHGFKQGQVIRLEENTGLATLALADTHKNSATTAVISEIIDENNFYAGLTGATVKGIDASSVEGGLPLEVGKAYFLSSVVPGQITRVIPDGAGQIVKLVGLAIDVDSLMIFSYTGYENETALTGEDIITAENGNIVRQKNTWMRTVESISYHDPLDAERINGKRYIVSSNAIGEWAGKEGFIAEYVRLTDSWNFTAPENGFMVVVKDIAEVYTYTTANGWSPLLFNYVKKTGDTMSGNLEMDLSDIIFHNSSEWSSNVGKVTSASGELALVSPQVVSLNGNSIRFVAEGANPGSFVKIGDNGILEYTTIDQEETVYEDTDTTQRNLSGYDFQSIGLSITVGDDINSGTIFINMLATSSASTALNLGIFVNDVQVGNTETFTVYQDTIIDGSYPIETQINSGDIVELKARESTGASNITLLNDVHTAILRIEVLSGLKIVAGTGISVSQTNNVVTVSSTTSTIDRDILYGHNDTVSQTIGASYRTINFSSIISSPAGYTIGSNDGGTTITVSEDGTYILDTNVSVRNESSSRRHGEMAIFVNGTEINGSGAYSYNRNANDGYDTATVNCLVVLSANDVVEVKMKSVHGSISTVGNGCRIRMEKV